jgi:hypothetical protein
MTPLLPDSADEPMPDPADEAATDERLRRMLAAYGEPAPHQPPPATRARVLASLPDLPPAQAAAAAAGRARGRRWLRRIALALLLLLAALGGWGVFFDSSAPAHLFGDVSSGLGQVLLILVLAAKPLVAALLAPGLPWLLGGLVLCAGLLRLWWMLARYEPLARPRPTQARV